MCNCITEVTKSSRSKLKEDNEGKAIITGGYVSQVAVFFSGPSKTYNDFEYKLTPIKKDGTEGKQIKKTVSLIHSFCPFCGEKYNKEEMKEVHEP